MSAPEFVPEKPGRAERVYTSPPRRAESWLAERPGDLQTGRQPRGVLLGVPGPDQGYALALANRWRDRLVLRDGEDPDDAIAGAVVIALKRAALFGRAPVSPDLGVALKLFGFVDAGAPDDLVSLRREWFSGLANAHHYTEARHLTARVPDDVLRRAPENIDGQTWRELV